MMHTLNKVNNSRLGQYLHTVFPQLKISVFSLVLFITSVAQTFAQLTTADVVGTVSDSSGAVVPNANVTLKNLDTNEVRSAQSNGSGDYSFTLLPVGHYSITVKASGFQIDPLGLLNLNRQGRLAIGSIFPDGSELHAARISVRAQSTFLAASDESAGELKLMLVRRQ